jgi:hypothetical protein
VYYKNIRVQYYFCTSVGPRASVFYSRRLRVQSTSTGHKSHFKIRFIPSFVSERTRVSELFDFRVSFLQGTSHFTVLIQQTLLIYSFIYLSIYPSIYLLCRYDVHFLLLSCCGVLLCRRDQCGENCLYQNASTSRLVIAAAAVVVGFAILCIRTGTKGTVSFESSL